MWQRVQTLYLAIATVLVAVMFFSIKGVTHYADGSIDTEIKYISYTPYLIFLVVITLLNLIALTTFKVRVFQMRTAMLSAIVTFAFQVWLVVDFIFTHDVVTFKWTAVFPIVAVIFDVLAARGILADQMLVESVYHLRKSRRERRVERRG